jgi:hypothetical protein
MSILLGLSIHPQVGHPMGQVPFTGVTHLGPMPGPGPGTSQHSVPVMQHEPPQQRPVVAHICGLAHGGVPHFPKLQ